jgi:hypothetical protein
VVRQSSLGSKLPAPLLGDPASPPTTWTDDDGICLTAGVPAAVAAVNDDIFHLSHTPLLNLKKKSQKGTKFHLTRSKATESHQQGLAKDTAFPFLLPVPSLPLHYNLTPIIIIISPLSPEQTTNRAARQSGNRKNRKQTKHNHTHTHSHSHTHTHTQNERDGPKQDENIENAPVNVQEQQPKTKQEVKRSKTGDALTVDLVEQQQSEGIPRR